MAATHGVLPVLLILIYFKLSFSEETIWKAWDFGKISKELRNAEKSSPSMPELDIADFSKAFRSFSRSQPPYVLSLRFHKLYPGGI